VEEEGCSKDGDGDDSAAKLLSGVTLFCTELISISSVAGPDEAEARALTVYV